MFTRRHFLQLTAAGSAASLLPGSAAAAETPGAVPAPIAALSSMRDQARPVSREERAARLENARRLMRDNRLDAMVLAGGTSLVYFSNIRWWLSERFFCMVVPAKGDPFYVCPAFEEGRAREQVGKGPLDGAHAEVRTWEEDDDPYQRFAQGCKDRGIASGRIGLEEFMYFAYTDGLAHAVPGAQFVSATPVTAGCRMIKSAHELELMQLASTVTWKAYKAAYESLKEGMTQNDFARLVSDAHTRLGFEGGAGVQVGEYSALPHGSALPQTIREGTILLIDGGCEVEGYASDISRTFVLGKPAANVKDKMNKVFEIERRAQDAALAAAAPGVACEAVDAAARKVITDAGYGPGYKYFSHRVGHGMGMDGHEWPYLVRGNKQPLAPNMVFSDEPGIYIRGEFGIRLEDDMHITEKGAALFTPQSPSLEDPFGK